MRITTVRRISQAFFLVLAVWLAVVATLGTEWHRLRGWPINWLLELDPLVGLGTLLAGRTLYAGLLWGALTLGLTIVLGRFFCGWVCPFGTIHQAAGFLGRRGKPLAHQVAANRYRQPQATKYLVLLAMLGLAAGGFLYTGLLDPIPLLFRSINLSVLPIADGGVQVVTSAQRYFDGAWLIGLFVAAAIVANLWIPRFYCRFVCPLGALLGLASRWSIGRIGKRSDGCTHCGLCERNCEGACQPSTKIRWSECVLCGNCLHQCPRNLMAYGAARSAQGEVTSPDVGRRGVLLALLGGVAAAPLIRLSGRGASNWDPSIIRPPGSLDEERFLARCIRCGQCMRVCPTNVIQPAGLQHAGLEGLWTPVMNNRIGSSGCQLNCVTCGNVCPTAAIRPLSLDEKHGTGPFTSQGPIRIGTAFVDQGRCLPWAMNTPCIVCQENCPVSPKAIIAREAFSTIHEAAVAGSTTSRVELSGAALTDGKLITGDYYLSVGEVRRRIAANTSSAVELAEPLDEPLASGAAVSVQVRLQRPVVDVSRCIGCGVCEHECPVSGRRAIRVTAENESRSRDRALLV